MIKALLNLSLGLSLIFVAEASYAEKVVASVNGRKITLKEFNSKYDKVRAETMNPPSKSVFLEDLIRYEIGVQEAKKKKLKEDPKIQEEIDKVLYRWLVERAIGNKTQKIKVTERDMKAYYRRNPEIRTSHILIEVKANAKKSERAVARKRAKEILSEVKKSKRPFEDLVKLYTDDIPTKRNGGDLGWQSRVIASPEYYEAAYKTRIGKIARLVETRYGFHIVKVTGRHSYKDANKRQLRFAVFETKRKKIFDEYFKVLKRKYKISSNKSLVK